MKPASDASGNVLLYLRARIAGCPPGAARADLFFFLYLALLFSPLYYFVISCFQFLVLSLFISHVFKHCQLSNCIHASGSLHIISHAESASWAERFPGENTSVLEVQVADRRCRLGHHKEVELHLLRSPVLELESWIWFSYAWYSVQRRSLAI
jgi:hypothetical protein